MRYVQGSEITLRQLAKESDRNPSVIFRWSSKEQWEAERKHVESKLRAATLEKTIEKTSNKLSDEISDIATEHFNSAKYWRQLADLIVKGTIKQATKAQKKGDGDFLKEIEKIKSQGINLSSWNLILDRSIKMERTALGLEYEDVNKAIAYLQKLGYEVRDPSLTEQKNSDTTTEKKVVASKGLTEDQINTIRAGILGVSSDASDSATLPGEVGSGQLQGEDSGQESADRD